MVIRVHNNGEVSFDIYLQGFSDQASDRREQVLQVLAPLLDASHERILTRDGSAAIFGLEGAAVDGVMFNHVEGDAAWQVIYETAVAAKWVIMPIESAICIVHEDQRSSIPDEIAESGIMLVSSGSELMQASTS